MGMRAVLISVALCRMSVGGGGCKNAPLDGFGGDLQEGFFYGGCQCFAEVYAKVFDVFRGAYA